MRRLVRVIALAATVTGGMAQAADADLERALLQAFRPVPDYKRQANAGAAIRDYKAAGVLALKPNARVDYTDYYVVLRPVPFLANELVIVEEEYMTKHIGCCVNEGAGVFVRVTSGVDALKRFARDNLCRLDEFANAKEVLAETSLRVALPAGRYAALRCHARDEDKK